MSPATPSPDPAESIGSYKIKRKLGAGGMGEVLLAYDERLQRDVAIKRVRGGALGEEQRERLRREARAAAALSHPSIVQVYDIIEEADGDAIVMEYLEGRTLWDLITAGDLEGQAAISVLLQVTDGLDAAHQRGLVHRDLKAENVIVSVDGTAKILDFGVAKLLDPSHRERTLTTDGTAVGTYRVMSPEQCEAGPIDARSDLFSLGVLMYEMFGGRTPFAGKTPLHTLANVAGFVPPPVAELNASVPRELSELVASLLEKDREERPASAAAVAAALETFQDSGLLAGLVIPRFTAAPDTGIDPIGSVPSRTSSARRRRSTKPAPTRRGRRWGTGAVVGVGTLAAAVAVFVISRGFSSDADASSSRIMVFPLVVSGGSDVPASVGEDVATMIGVALEQTAPLLWIDAWPLLDGQLRSDIRTLTAAQALSLASSRDCGYYIEGRVVTGGDSAHVVLHLREAGSGDQVMSTEASGPLAEPWRAGLRAVNDLLPRLIPTEVPDVEADFAGRPPAAVAQFLLGESAFRRADMDVALTHFQVAFQADPTFALAGIRGAQTASWQHDPEAARQLVDAVLELPLRTRSEAFARGIKAYVEYDAEAAVVQLNAALAEDSTMAVAWAALGEVYRHRAPRQPWRSGPRPFERAARYDSLAGNVLFHRLEEVIRAGNLASARVLLDRFRRGDPDADLLKQIEAMFECADRGPNSRDWTEVAAEGNPVMIAGQQMLVGASNPPCGEALLRAVLIADTVQLNAEGRYWAAWLGLTGSKLARAQLDDARRLILAGSEGFETFQSLIDRSAVSADGVALPRDDAPWTVRPTPLRRLHEESLTRWTELAVAVALVYPELQDVGALGAGALREAAGPDYTGVPYRTSLFFLGVWEARSGRPDAARRVAARIRANAEDEDDVMGPYSRRLADALEAHALLAEGEERQALERLRELTANAREGVIHIELPGSLALERLVRANLEERLGDPAEALRLVLGFDEPSAAVHVLFLPPGLATCVRTANLLRQTSLARSCEARLTDLGWSIEDLQSPEQPSG